MKEDLKKWTKDHPIATMNIGFGIIFCVGYRLGLGKGQKMTMQSVNHAFKELDKLINVTKF